MDLQTSQELIQRIQNGTATVQDQNRIVREILRRYKPHKLNNYIYDAEEMKCEYVLAAWNAVSRAKINIGDPIAFCVNRGRGAMMDYYRKVDSSKLIKVCPICNKTVTHDRRNIYCKDCNAEYESYVKEELMSINEFDLSSTEVSTEDIVLEQMEIDYKFSKIERALSESSEISREDKMLAMECVKYRMHFYDYCRMIGKSPQWSQAFTDRIINFIKYSLQLA